MIEKEGGREQERDVHIYMYVSICINIYVYIYIIYTNMCASVYIEYREKGRMDGAGVEGWRAVEKRQRAFRLAHCGTAKRQCRQLAVARQNR